MPKGKINLRRVLNACERQVGNLYSADSLKRDRVNKIISWLGRDLGKIIDDDALPVNDTRNEDEVISLAQKFIAIADAIDKMHGDKEHKYANGDLEATGSSPYLPLRNAITNFHDQLADDDTLSLEEIFKNIRTAVAEEIQKGERPKLPDEAKTTISAKTDREITAEEDKLIAGIAAAAKAKLAPVVSPVALPPKPKDPIIEIVKEIYETEHTFYWGEEEKKTTSLVQLSQGDKFRKKLAAISENKKDQRGRDQYIFDRFADTLAALADSKNKSPLDIKKPTEADLTEAKVMERMQSPEFTKRLEQMVSAALCFATIQNYCLQDGNPLQAELIKEMDDLIKPVQRIPRYVLLLNELLNQKEKIKAKKIASTAPATEITALEREISIITKQRDEIEKFAKKINELRRMPLKATCDYFFTVIKEKLSGLALDPMIRHEIEESQDLLSLYKVIYKHQKNPSLEPFKGYIKHFLINTLNLTSTKTLQVMNDAKDKLFVEAIASRAYRELINKAERKEAKELLTTAWNQQPDLINRLITAMVPMYMKPGELKRPQITVRLATDVFEIIKSLSDPNSIKSILEAHVPETKDLIGRAFYLDKKEDFYKQPKKIKNFFEQLDPGTKKIIEDEIKNKIDPKAFAQLPTILSDLISDTEKKDLPGYLAQSDLDAFLSKLSPSKREAIEKRINEKFPDTFLGKMRYPSEHEFRILQTIFMSHIPKKEERIKKAIEQDKVSSLLKSIFEVDPNTHDALVKAIKEHNVKKLQNAIPEEVKKEMHPPFSKKEYDILSQVFSIEGFIPVLSRAEKKEEKATKKSAGLLVTPEMLNKQKDKLQSPAKQETELKDPLLRRLFTELNKILQLKKIEHIDALNKFLLTYGLDDKSILKKLLANEKVFPTITDPASREAALVNLLVLSLKENPVIEPILKKCGIMGDNPADLAYQFNQLHNAEATKSLRGTIAAQATSDYTARIAEIEKFFTKSGEEKKAQPLPAASDLKAPLPAASVATPTSAPPTSPPPSTEVKTATPTTKATTLPQKTSIIAEVKTPNLRKIFDEEFKNYNGILAGVKESAEDKAAIEAMKERAFHSYINNILKALSGNTKGKKLNDKEKNKTLEEIELKLEEYFKSGRKFDKLHPALFMPSSGLSRVGAVLRKAAFGWMGASAQSSKFWETVLHATGEIRRELPFLDEDDAKAYQKMGPDLSQPLRIIDVFNAVRGVDNEVYLSVKHFIQGRFARSIHKILDEKGAGYIKNPYSYLEKRLLDQIYYKNISLSADQYAALNRLINTQPLHLSGIDTLPVFSVDAQDQFRATQIKELKEILTAFEKDISAMDKALNELKAQAKKATGDDDRAIKLINAILTKAGISLKPNEMEWVTQEIRKLGKIDQTANLETVVDTILSTVSKYLLKNTVIEIENVIVKDLSSFKFPIFEGRFIEYGALLINDPSLTHAQRIELARVMPDIRINFQRGYQQMTQQMEEQHKKAISACKEHKDLAPVKAFYHNMTIDIVNAATAMKNLQDILDDRLKVIGDTPETQKIMDMLKDIEAKNVRPDDINHICQLIKSKTPTDKIKDDANISTDVINYVTRFNEDFAKAYQKSDAEMDIALSAPSIRANYIQYLKDMRDKYLDNIDLYSDATIVSEADRTLSSIKSATPSEKREIFNWLKDIAQAPSVSVSKRLLNPFTAQFQILNRDFIRPAKEIKEAEDKLVDKKDNPKWPAAYVKEMRNYFDKEYIKRQKWFDWYRDQLLPFGSATDDYTRLTKQLHDSLFNAFLNSIDHLFPKNIPTEVQYNKMAEALNTGIISEGSFFHSSGKRDEITIDLSRNIYNMVRTVGNGINAAFTEPANKFRDKIIISIANKYALDDRNKKIIPSEKFHEQRDKYIKAAQEIFSDSTITALNPHQKLAIAHRINRLDDINKPPSEKDIQSAVPDITPAQARSIANVIVKYTEKVKDIHNPDWRKAPPQEEKDKSKEAPQPTREDADMAQSHGKETKAQGAATASASSPPATPVDEKKKTAPLSGAPISTPPPGSPFPPPSTSVVDEKKITPAAMTELKDILSTGKDKMYNQAYQKIKEIGVTEDGQILKIVQPLLGKIQQLTVDNIQPLNLTTGQAQVFSDLISSAELPDMKDLADHEAFKIDPNKNDKIANIQAIVTDLFTSRAEVWEAATAAVVPANPAPSASDAPKPVKAADSMGWDEAGSDAAEEAHEEENESKGSQNKEAGEDADHEHSDKTPPAEEESHEEAPVEGGDVKAEVSEDAADDAPAADTVKANVGLGMEHKEKEHKHKEPEVFVDVGKGAGDVVVDAGVAEEEEAGEDAPVEVDDVETEVSEVSSGDAPASDSVTATVTVNLDSGKEHAAPVAEGMGKGDNEEEELEESGEEADNDLTDDEEDEADKEIGEAIRKIFVDKAKEAKLGFGVEKPLEIKSVTISLDLNVIDPFRDKIDSISFADRMMIAKYLKGEGSLPTENTEKITDAIEKMQKKMGKYVEGLKEKYPPAPEAAPLPPAPELKAAAPVPNTPPPSPDVQLQQAVNTLTSSIIAEIKMLTDLDTKKYVEAITSAEAKLLQDLKEAKIKPEQIQALLPFQLLGNPMNDPQINNCNDALKTFYRSSLPQMRTAILHSAYIKLAAGLPEDKKPELYSSFEKIIIKTNELKLTPIQAKAIAGCLVVGDKEPNLTALLAANPAFQGEQATKLAGIQPLVTQFYQTRAQLLKPAEEKKAANTSVPPPLPTNRPPTLPHVVTPIQFSTSPQIKLALDTYLQTLTSSLTEEQKAACNAALKTAAHEFQTKNLSDGGIGDYSATPDILKVVCERIAKGQVLPDHPGMDNVTKSYNTYFAKVDDIVNRAKTPKPVPPPLPSIATLPKDEKKAAPLLTGGLYPLPVNYGPKPADEKDKSDYIRQAKEILNAATELKKAGYKKIGITYSANTSQIKPIRDTYLAIDRGDPWRPTRTGGENQAAVVEQIEILLQSEYKDLQQEFRILPITTMKPDSSTADTSLITADLDHIENEYLKKGAAVIAWQNQEKSADKPYAVGGGVAAGFTDEQSQMVQNRLKGFEATYKLSPDITLTPSSLDEQLKQAVSKMGDVAKAAVTVTPNFGTKETNFYLDVFKTHEAKLISNLNKAGITDDQKREIIEAVNKNTYQPRFIASEGIALTEQENRVNVALINFYDHINRDQKSMVLYSAYIAIRNEVESELTRYGETPDQITNILPPMYDAFVAVNREAITKNDLFTQAQVNLIARCLTSGETAPNLTALLKEKPEFKAVGELDKLASLQAKVDAMYAKRIEILQRFRNNATPQTLLTNAMMKIAEHQERINRLAPGTLDSSKAPVSNLINDFLNETVIRNLNQLDAKKLADLILLHAGNLDGLKKAIAADTTLKALGSVIESFYGCFVAEAEFRKAINGSLAHMISTINPAVSPEERKKAEDAIKQAYENFTSGAVIKLSFLQRGKFGEYITKTEPPPLGPYLNINTSLVDSIAKDGDALNTSITAIVDKANATVATKAPAVSPAVTPEAKLAIALDYLTGLYQMNYINLSPIPDDMKANYNQQLKNAEQKFIADLKGSKLDPSQMDHIANYITSNKKIDLFPANPPSPTITAANAAISKYNAAVIQILANAQLASTYQPIYQATFDQLVRLVDVDKAAKDISKIDDSFDVLKRAILSKGFNLEEIQKICQALASPTAPDISKIFAAADLRISGLQPFINNFYTARQTAIANAKSAAPASGLVKDALVDIVKYYENHYKLVPGLDSTKPPISTHIDEFLKRISDSNPTEEEKRKLATILYNFSVTGDTHGAADAINNVKDVLAPAYLRFVNMMISIAETEKFRQGYIKTAAKQFLAGVATAAQSDLINNAINLFLAIPELEKLSGVQQNKLYSYINKNGASAAGVALAQHLGTPAVSADNLSKITQAITKLDTDVNAIITAANAAIPSVTPTPSTPPSKPIVTPSPSTAPAQPPARLPTPPAAPRVAKYALRFEAKDHKAAGDLLHNLIGQLYRIRAIYQGSGHVREFKNVYDQMGKVYDDLLAIQKGIELAGHKSPPWDKYQLELADTIKDAQRYTNDFEKNQRALQGGRGYVKGQKVLPSLGVSDVITLKPGETWDQAVQQHLSNPALNTAPSLLHLGRTSPDLKYWTEDIDATHVRLTTLRAGDKPTDDMIGRFVERTDEVNSQYASDLVEIAPELKNENVLLQLMTHLKYIGGNPLFDSDGKPLPLTTIAKALADYLETNNKDIRDKDAIKEFFKTSPGQAVLPKGWGAQGAIEFADELAKAHKDNFESNDSYRDKLRTIAVGVVDSFLAVTQDLTSEPLYISNAFSADIVREILHVVELRNRDLPPGQKIDVRDESGYGVQEDYEKFYRKGPFDTQTKGADDLDKRLVEVSEGKHANSPLKPLVSKLPKMAKSVPLDAKQKAALAREGIMPKQLGVIEAKRQITTGKKQAHNHKLPSTTPPTPGSNTPPPVPPRLGKKR